MLREITATRQNNDNLRMRWFTDSDMDLYIWFKKSDIESFQLTYDKQGDEHAINWEQGGRFSHSCVDSGETLAYMQYKMSPILMPDGSLDAIDVAHKFLLSSNNLEKTIIEFIYARLLEYPQLNENP